MASSTSQLTSQPLQDTSSFNFVFLIEWITIGILTVWFLFYFNRVLATIVSYAVRLYTWHRLGVYVDIEALQISLLAGRIFFKGVHYHGDNETIHIHGGYVTWRYWLRSVKQCRVFQEQRPEPLHTPKAESRSTADSHSSSDPDLEVNAPSPPHVDLPCRIEIKVSGVEAFIYNRGPAYDFIVDGIAKHSKEKQRQDAPWHARRASTDNTQDSATVASDPASAPISSRDEKGAARPGEASPSSSSADDNHDTNGSPGGPPAPPSFLRLLPIRVECNTAAAVLGNENTPSIVTAKVDSASGEFDAGAAGSLDVFRILMAFDIQKPHVQLKPNVDYKRPQLAEAAILKQTANPTGQVNATKSKSSRGGIYGPLRLNLGWTRLIGLSKKANASLESVVNFSRLNTTDEKLPDATQDRLPGQARWLGLTRYLDDDQHDERDEWQDVEYAKSSTVAELDSVTFKFHWDVPGRRMPEKTPPGPSIHPVRDINGSDPPKYGMEIIVYGGRVFYGPWADRHRIILQQIFFPAGFTDAHETPKVKPGEYRLFSTFDLLLRIEADTVLRIPFKEPSRDWKWKGRADAVTGQKHSHGQDKARSRRRAKHGRPDKSTQSTDARPYAWFDIKVLADSTISYAMDMYPYADGYRNELSVDVKGIEIASSLNHAHLFKSQGVSLQCSLPYTLAWNGLREWLFQINIKNMDLFLLRDHTFLLVDLIEDWTAGPPSPFFTFVPYRYILKTHFDNFRMFLNVNDANIVDSSDDIDDNDFVILYGRVLDADLTIPLDRLRPAQSEIKFDVESHDLGFELSMPPKNTLNALLDRKNVAKLPTVILRGTYGLCTEVRPGLTETLRMEITGVGLRIIFYGFFARQLVKIKENYFGDTIHFRTYEEFQDLLATPNVEPHGLVQNSTKSNDLDVILDIVAEDAIIFIPAGLYTCDDFIDLRIAHADVDLRVNNYYLELMVDSCPLSIGHSLEKAQHKEFEASKSGADIVIDGVNVFGHRLFGHSPAEPAYVSNWDIDAGDILGDMTCDFLSKALAAGQALALTLTDEENGLPLPDVEPLYDMTLVRFQCSLIRLWLRAADVAFLASISDVAGTFDDRCTEHFSQRLDMSIPDVHVACTSVDGRPSPGGKPAVNETAAFLQTSVSFQMVQRCPNFERSRMLQQAHIALHDSKGLRAQFLLPDSQRSKSGEVTSLCLPKLPAPLQRDHFQEMPMLGAQHSTGTLQNRTLQDETSGETLERQSGHNQPFASGSIFDKPTLPLDGIKIDLDDVPRFLDDETKGTSGKTHAADSLFNGSLDDDAVHTSLIIQLRPGVRVMCKPRAVQAVAKIIEDSVTKDPAFIFDQYQMSTVQEVIALLTRKRGKRTVLDISLKVPFFHARFINPGVPVSSEQSSGDEYNFTSRDVTAMIRLKSTPEMKLEDEFKAVHLTGRSIAFSAQKHTRAREQGEVAFKAGLDDLLLWVADGGRTSVRATFRSLETVFLGQDVRYLSSLVHRTTILADSLQAPFASLTEQNDRRRRYLVYRLTRHWDEVGDPSFLTRPSYMIRSAKNHLRNSDSWKLIARLRWVLHCLGPEERLDIRQHCLNDNILLPDDAESSILAKLDDWRSWDAIHVKDSIAMRLLLNSGIGAAKLQDRSTIPVSVLLQASVISLKVGYGQKQNELLLDSLALALSITPPPPPSAMQIFHDYQEVRMTTVQVNSSGATINLNWDICELADSILMLFEQQAPGQKGHLNNLTSQSTNQQEVESNKEEFHVVFASDKADINIESINIIQTLASVGLKVSVTGQIDSGDSQPPAFNSLASAETAWMSMARESQEVWRSAIIKPALIVALRTISEQRRVVNTLHIAGDCSELHVDIKQDVLGLLEIANLILNEEVKYIRDLVQKHEGSFSASNATDAAGHTSDASGRANAMFKINLALFLKQYYFRASIHPTLHILTEGRVARLAISPEASDEERYRADFDLKEHSYHVLAGAVERPNNTSTLNMPSINGTLRVTVQPKELKVSTMVTMEQVRLEGASVYGIVAALSTPAATSAFESINADVQTIQAVSKELFPPVSKPHASTDSSSARAIVFHAGLVFAGLSLVAAAPSKTDGHKPADITFTLGSTRLRVSNQRDGDERLLPFPEFSFILGDMDLDIRRGTEKSGSAKLALKLECKMDHVGDGFFRQSLELSAVGPVIAIQGSTAPIVIDVIAHFQDLLHGLDLSKEKKYLKRLRHPREIPALIRRATSNDTSRPEASSDDSRFTSSLAFDIRGILVSYEVGNGSYAEDLVLSVKSSDLLTRSEKEARLRVDELQLQLVPSGQSKTKRSANSALLPEIIFNVTHENKPEGRRLSFRAAGKALDLQLEPGIVKPIKALEKSFAQSADETQNALRSLQATPAPSTVPRNLSLGRFRIVFVFVTMDFAGSVIRLQGARESVREGTARAHNVNGIPHEGRFGQFLSDNSSTSAVLRVPGIAIKARYEDLSTAESSLNIEVRVDGSNNTLTPSVVPLILQIFHHVKETMQESEEEDKARVLPKEVSRQDSTQATQILGGEDALIQADPRAILGRVRLNFGLRICKQEFSLTCQPIAKVAATAKLEDIYLAVNTIESSENGHFFSISATIAGIQASLQHVYSREATFVFYIESIVLSMMNSKHISGTNGISAILRINPMKAQLNAKQLQDTLLFREIWLPPEIRNSAANYQAAVNTDTQDYFVSRYRQIAASTAFPWNATIAMANLSVEIDLGQAIGKLSARITHLWASSKKTTSSKQTLSFGVEDIGVDSSGRSSGFVRLSKVRVRTSIAWPSDSDEFETPLVQGSVGFHELRLKSAFDYQVFAVAHITDFEFIMYNVRDREQKSGDRLVAILDGNKINVYCVAASAALAVSLAQAVERLVQEKKASYDQSLKDIEKFLRRRSTSASATAVSNTSGEGKEATTERGSKIPISLQTDVVVTLRSVNVGAFPRTMVDNQVLKLEAANVEARFAVVLEEEQIHSGLGLTLGQVSAALGSTAHQTVPSTLTEIEVEQVVKKAAMARGGVILRVPRVVAAMQTWQGLDSKAIDYTFKSTLEGKIDVGWNYSRISFIKSMWETHCRTLASRLGRPLPESALKITGPGVLPEAAPKQGQEAQKSEEERKITAVVNLPQSKYSYRALQTPIIDTPQLRDMGEATPPLEWIGLHRDRLPNVTHQIAIVTLLEVAKEVEDAYSRILGSAK